MELKTKKTPIAQVMDKPKGYTLEDYYKTPEKMKPDFSNPIQIFKVLLVYVLIALYKSIVIFPWFVFLFFISIFLFVPADVLFLLKTELQHLSVNNIVEFSFVINTLKKFFFNVGLISFAFAFISNLQILFDGILRNKSE